MTWVRIKDIAQINANALPDGTDPDYRFRYIDIGAVDSSGGISMPVDEIKFSESPSRARRTARPGAVIVSTVRTYLRAVSSVPVSKTPLVFSTGFAVLEARPTVDDNYLAYYCRSSIFIEEVVARSVGVNYPAVNSSDIGSIKLRLPSMEEQRRIARFLAGESHRIDRLTTGYSAALKLLTERRSVGVFSEIVGSQYPETRKSTLAWVDSVPASWNVVRLSLVARMGSGHTPSRSHPEWWLDCTIPWITTGEVSQVRDDRREIVTETREQISELGLKNSSAELHPAGTVFLCRTAASAGYSAIMGRDMTTSQDIVTWTCGPRLTNLYLLWCLRAMRPDLLGRLAMGSTHKTIYVPDLQMLRIPLPTLAEQHEITKRIQQKNAQIDDLADKISKQLGLLLERKQMLITMAVTGQFDVSTASGRGIEDGLT